MPKSSAPSAKEWFSAEELTKVGDPFSPTTVQGWNKMARRDGWRNTAFARRVGKGWLYHLTLLPGTVQTRLKYPYMFPPRSLT